MIRIDALWLAAGPVDMRVGAERLLARVVQVFGCTQAHHGYLMYVWLGELDNLMNDRAFRNSGVDARIKEAHTRFGNLPVEATFNPFLHSVRCRSTTPRITYQEPFTQTVTTTCSTNRGPADVNLHSLHITVGGKDIWNGQANEYLGRSIKRAFQAAIEPAVDFSSKARLLTAFALRPKSGWPATRMIDRLHGKA